jgi:type II secretory pathway component PulL
LIACATLLVLTAAIWFAGLFVQLSTLESQHARLKEQIHGAFRQALPEEKNIVNPLAQLQQKLDAFQRSTR